MGDFTPNQMIQVDAISRNNFNMGDIVHVVPTFTNTSGDIELHNSTANPLFIEYISDNQFIVATHITSNESGNKNYQVDSFVFELSDDEKSLTLISHNENIMWIMPSASCSKVRDKMYLFTYSSSSSYYMVTYKLENDGTMTQLKSQSFSYDRLYRVLTDGIIITQYDGSKYYLMSIDEEGNFTRAGQLTGNDARLANSIEIEDGIFIQGGVNNGIYKCALNKNDLSFTSTLTPSTSLTYNVGAYIGESASISQPTKSYSKFINQSFSGVNGKTIFCKAHSANMRCVQTLNDTYTDIIYQNYGYVDSISYTVPVNSQPDLTTKGQIFKKPLDNGNIWFISRGAITSGTTSSSSTDNVSEVNTLNYTLMSPNNPCIFSCSNLNPLSNDVTTIEYNHLYEYTPSRNACIEVTNHGKISILRFDLSIRKYGTKFIKQDISPTTAYDIHPNAIILEDATVGQTVKVGLLLYPNN